MGSNQNLEIDCLSFKVKKVFLVNTNSIRDLGIKDIKLKRGSKKDLLYIDLYNLKCY
jgi:hypothetical protein